MSSIYDYKKKTVQMEDLVTTDDTPVTDGSDKTQTRTDQLAKARQAKAKKRLRTEESISDVQSQVQSLHDKVEFLVSRKKQKIDDKKDEAEVVIDQVTRPSSKIDPPVADVDDGPSFTEQAVKAGAIFLLSGCSWYLQNVYGKTKTKKTQPAPPPAKPAVKKQTAHRKSETYSHVRKPSPVGNSGFVM